MVLEVLEVVIRVGKCLVLDSANLVNKNINLYEFAYLWENKLFLLFVS